jgi:hypothetical protein
MAYEIIASTGALATLAGLAPNPPTMLAIIDLAHGTRQLAGYAYVHVDTCAKRGWIERRPSVRTCIISAVMTYTGPLVELTSPRRVPCSARWRGRTAVAPPPLPVRPRPPYYWFAEHQEEQPSAFTTLPTPPHPSRHALLPTRSGTDIPRPSRPDRQTPSTRHTSPTSSLQQRPPLFHPQPLFFPLASPPRSDGPSSTFRYQPRFFKNPLGIARA